MRLSLEWQISLALLGIAGLFATVLGLNQMRFAESLQDQNPLAYAREVSQRSVDLERRGDNYKAVAPRTHRDFDRDLKVFYGDLQADLAGLAAAVHAVESERPETSDPRAAAIDAPVNSHAAFVEGLWAKLTRILVSTPTVVSRSDAHR
jgi:hypothetical protein